MSKKYIAQKTMTNAATIALGKIYVPKGVQIKSVQTSTTEKYSNQRDKSTKKAKTK